MRMVFSSIYRRCIAIDTRRLLKWIGFVFAGMFVGYSYIYYHYTGLAFVRHNVLLRPFAHNLQNKVYSTDRPLPNNIVKSSVEDTADIDNTGRHELNNDEITQGRSSVEEFALKTDKLILGSVGKASRSTTRDENSPSTTSVKSITSVKHDRVSAVTGETEDGTETEPEPEFVENQVAERHEENRDTNKGVHGLDESQLVTLTQEATTTSARYVLLVTYARSGSSWLGHMVSQSPNSLYVFEPFFHLIYQGYYKKDLVCYNNNTCRSPRKYTETHKFAIQDLYYFYTCQLHKTNIQLRKRLAKDYRQFVSAEDERACAGQPYYDCMDPFVKLCYNSTNRIIKTIRMSMELVESLIQLFPSLKVIHLVRDPRGITNSRRKESSFRMVRATASHSRDMCNRMSDDVRLDTALTRKYPSRVLLVVYESLAVQPITGAEKIFEFLNVTVTTNIKDWIYNSTHASKTVKATNEFFSTARSDSNHSAYHWRKELPPIIIEVVDDICTPLYKILGYLPIESRAHLRNTSISLRVPIHDLEVNGVW